MTKKKLRCFLDSFDLHRESTIGDTPLSDILEEQVSDFKKRVDEVKNSNRNDLVIAYMLAHNVCPSKLILVEKQTKDGWEFSVKERKNNENL